MEVRENFVKWPWNDICGSFELKFKEKKDIPLALWNYNHLTHFLVLNLWNLYYTRIQPSICRNRRSKSSGNATFTKSFYSPTYLNHVILPTWEHMDLYSSVCDFDYGGINTDTQMSLNQSSWFADATYSIKDNYISLSPRWDFNGYFSFNRVVIFLNVVCVFIRTFRRTNGLC